MAMLTVAILTVAILTMAILTMAYSGYTHYGAPRVLPVVVDAIEVMLLAQREQPRYEPGKG